MRKYLLCTLITVLFYLSSLSQFTKESEDLLYAKIDSLKRAAIRLSGKAKVDCLNTIVDQYQIMDEDNQMQVDSAGPYARQAYSNSIKVDYKRGLGYASLKLSYIKLLWGQIHKDDKKYSGSYADSLNSAGKLISESIHISKELSDFTMMGSAYHLLGWMEGLRGNKEKQLQYHQEAISFIERQAIQPKNEYAEMNYTNCRDCSGQEFRLAELYGGLGRLTLNKSDALKKALLLYKKAEAYPAVSTTYSGLIYIANSDGNAEEAKGLINEAISYFKNKGDSKQVGDFFMHLARVFGVKNNTKAAVDNFRKAVSL
jgi:hypothetical protein